MVFKFLDTFNSYLWMTPSLFILSLIPKLWNTFLLSCDYIGKGFSSKEQVLDLQI